MPMIVHMATESYMMSRHQSVKASTLMRQLRLLDFLTGGVMLDMTTVRIWWSMIVIFFILKMENSIAT